MVTEGGGASAGTEGGNQINHQAADNWTRGPRGAGGGVNSDAAIRN